MTSTVTAMRADARSIQHLVVLQGLALATVVKTRVHRRTLLVARAGPANSECVRY